MHKQDFGHRIAQDSDLADIRALMDAAIRELQKGFLSTDQIQASFEVMGLDTQLIKDGTYLLILDGDHIVGCGGWSYRKTLFGADHTKGRSDALLNPSKDAGRIRAMYTHPDWARRGIGKLIMDLCENSLKNYGFQTAELMATLSGIPLYEACGYAQIEPIEAETSLGIKVPLVRMQKSL